MNSGLDAILAGLGGGGGAPAGPAAPTAAGEDAGPSGDTSELIRQALEIIKQAIDAEDSDQTRLGLEEVTTRLQKVLAQEEQENEQALQGKMSPGLLRKSYEA